MALPRGHILGKKRNAAMYTDWQKKCYILPDFVALMKSYKHAIFLSKIISLESRLFVQFIHNVSGVKFCTC